MNETVHKHSPPFLFHEAKDKRRSSRQGMNTPSSLAAIQRGDGEAALREAKLEPNEGYRRFELALAYYARGERRAANEALAELIAKDRDFLAYQVAQVYA